MNLPETINALSPLIGCRIRFADGHEQDCVAIEETIFDNVFLDCGETHEDKTRIGYYVMPRNIERVEQDGDVLRLIGCERVGTITRLHRIGEQNAEKAA